MPPRKSPLRKKKKLSEDAFTDKFKTQWCKMVEDGMNPADAAEKVGIPYATILAVRHEDPIIKQAYEMSVVSVTTRTRSKKRILSKGSYGYKARVLEAVMDDGKFMEFLAKYMELADPTTKDGQRKFEFICREIVASMMPRESASRQIIETPNTTPKTFIEIESELVELETEERRVHAQLRFATNSRRDAAARLGRRPGLDSGESADTEKGEAGGPEGGQAALASGELETVEVCSVQSSRDNAERPEPAGEDDDLDDAGGLGPDGALSA